MRLFKRERLGLWSKIRNRIILKIVLIIISTIGGSLLIPFLGPLGPVVLEQIRNWLFPLLNQ